MLKRGRLAGRCLAIPLLGAVFAAALLLDLAWSQGPIRRGTIRTAQAPSGGPALAPGQPPPAGSADSTSPVAESPLAMPALIPARRSSEAPAREEINPLEIGEIEDYTVPLRGPSDGMVLESEDGLISLVARNASLQDVLTALAETQGLNLIMQETVTAQLNTTLHRVPFEDVLDVILSTSGYTWVRNRNVIQVTSMASSQTLAPETQGRLVEVFQLDHVSATDVDSVVQTMLSPAGSANVIESSATDNRRTREILVVQDLPIYLESIRNYIRRHDVPPRQVLIEAYILKVELGDDCKHGVDFDHLFNVENNLFHLESRGFANAATSQGFMVNLTGGNLIGVIEMLESTTDAKTLASPKIRVLNGQTARIQVGEQLGFRVTTTTETSTTESVQFLEVGVVLEVTPRIGSDGTIVMQVKPEVSSGLVNPNTGLPEEKTTELQTDVMFRDNQAYVIGGLIQETDSEVEQKLPILGSLKYIGFFFQRAEKVKRRSEVIVALLPRVMPFNAATNENLLIETERATTPLMYGPLHEYPRPWEPQLPHFVKNPHMLRLPPTAEHVPFKSHPRVSPRPALEPIEAASDEFIETQLPQELGQLRSQAIQRPGTNGSIGTFRMSRVPALHVRRPAGEGFSAPLPSSMLR